MLDRPLPVIVALCLALSGCAVVDTGAGGPTPTDGGVSTTVPGGEFVPQTEPVSATVVEVVDGDTLDIRYRNGTADTVRLLGVDTPEVHVATDPAEFEGVPDSEAGRRCLRSAGRDASVAVTDRLAGADVGLVVDPRSDRRGGYDRLLAYVVHDGRNVNYWLVARGHARVYDTSFRYAEEFYAAERDARERNAGVWRCRG